MQLHLNASEHEEDDEEAASPLGSTKDDRRPLSAQHDWEDGDVYEFAKQKALYMPNAMEG